MKLIFNSNAKSFLELYDPNIIFLNPTKIAETSSDVDYFLDEFGLTKEDLKAAGFGFNKNVITIPAGAKATVLATGNGETSLRFNILPENAKLTDISEIEFDYSFVYDSDQCEVEVECLDPGREKVFSAYNNRLPKAGDTTLLGKYYINDILEAVAELNFEGRRLPAFEEIKLMTDEEIYTKLYRYAQRLAANLNIVGFSLDTVETETLNIIKEMEKDV